MDKDYYLVGTFPQGEKLLLNHAIHKLKVPVRYFWRKVGKRYQLRIHRTCKDEWTSWEPEIAEQLKSGSLSWVYEVDGVDDLEGLGAIERLRLEDLVRKLGE